MQETRESIAVDEQEVGSGSEKRSKTGRNIGIALIVVVVLAIVGASIYGMIRFPNTTAALRDIAIISLALVTLIIGIFLIILIFQLQSLIVLLRDEIKPILDSAAETANTVRGTTTFVSDAVVTPLINAASVASGISQTIRALSRTGHRGKKRAKARPDPKQE